MSERSTAFQRLLAAEEAYWVMKEQYYAKVAETEKARKRVHDAGPITGQDAAGDTWCVYPTPSRENPSGVRMMHGEPPENLDAAKRDDALVTCLCAAMDTQGRLRVALGAVESAFGEQVAFYLGDPSHVQADRRQRARLACGPRTYVLQADLGPGGASPRWKLLYAPSPEDLEYPGVLS